MIQAVDAANSGLTGIHTGIHNPRTSLPCCDHVIPSVLLTCWSRQILSVRILTPKVSFSTLAAVPFLCLPGL